MPPKTGSPPQKRGKRYQFEFSRTSMVFWGLGIFLILAWMFVLGILVGRGFFPKGIEALTELKSQIVRLQNMVSRKESSGLEDIRGQVREPKLAFYDELSAKRKETPIKDKKKTSTSEAKKKPVGVQGKETTGSETGWVYALQLASLETENKAASMVERLTNQGYPAYSYKVHVKGKTYYRVRCGTFTTRKEADHYKSLLSREERIDSIVIRVRK
jgi:cell division protein FtsN